MTVPAVPVGMAGSRSKSRGIMTSVESEKENRAAIAVKGSRQVTRRCRRMSVPSHRIEVSAVVGPWVG